MSRTDIFDRLKHLIHEQIGVFEEEITLDMKLVDDLGTDSLDLVGLIMDCEADFGIEISDQEADVILTVGQAVDFIEIKLQPVLSGRM